MLEIVLLENYFPMLGHFTPSSSFKLTTKILYIIIRKIQLAETTNAFFVNKRIKFVINSALTD